MEDEPATLEGLPHVGLEQRSPARAAIEARVVEPADAAAARLRLVHRGVGMAKQGRPVLGIAGKRATPRLNVTTTALAVDRERRADRIENLPGDDQGVLGALQVLEDERELVAAETRHGIALAHPATQADRHGAQQLVAGRVAELVVHGLEAVEVGHGHGEAAAVAARGAQGAVQPVVEERRLARPVSGSNWARWSSRSLARLRAMAKRRQRSRRPVSSSSLSR